MTRMQHFWRLRVEAAIGMLEKTDMPLRTIAEKVGATDKSHLSRWIKSIAGHSSSKFRRSAQEGA